MRARLITLAAGAAALATGLAVPATTAQAATATTRGAPKPHHSLRVAGYQQTGCHHHGYPVYVEISGTIKVPAATDVDGTPGISYDIYSFGGARSGVNAGWRWITPAGRRTTPHLASGKARRSPPSRSSRVTSCR